MGFSTLAEHYRERIRCFTLPHIGDLRNYCIYFCIWDLELEKYHIGFLKISLFEVRNVEIDELIQFNPNSQW